MTGYAWDLGMSNNAAAAYESGRFPLSKISLHDLRREGWTESLKLARFLAKASPPLWRTFEWHHSGGDYFNRVDFYDPCDLVAAWAALSQDDQAAWRAKARAPAVVEPGRRVSGHYRTFDFRTRRPTGWQSFEGVKAGNWITLDSGRRKKSTGKHLTFHYID
jgi:hypothetical protein